MKIIFKVIIWLAIVMPLVTFAQWRDTLEVDNAILKGLSAKESDSVLVISGDTVYKWIMGGSPSFSADTFYIQYTCDTNMVGWVFSGDTVYIDSCAGRYAPLWEVSGNYLIPVDLSKGIALGNRYNYLTYDGSTGLVLQANPGEFKIKLGTTDAFKFRRGGTDYFSALTDNYYDLGQSSVEWKDGYFDGTIQTDYIQVDDSATIGTTTKTAPLTIGVDETVGTYSDGIHINGAGGSGNSMYIGSTAGSQVSIRSNPLSIISIAGGLGVYISPFLYVYDSISANDGSGNGVNIGTSKGITLTGTTKVWDDIRVAPTTEGVPAARQPTWTSYKSSYVLAFADESSEPNEESVYFICQLPHSYSPGTAIYPHVHFTTPTASTDTIVWQLSYTWASYGSTFADATTITVKHTLENSANKHMISEFASISGTGKEESSILICSLRRKSADASDTYTGDDIYLLECDFHYQVEKMGTANEYPD